jgi:phenylalanyl-tRNA synthetase alpha chain
MYVLTEEGRLYLKHGLPEKNLYELLKKGPLDIKTARQKIQNFDIALMWCKKKELIEIKSGHLHVLKSDDFSEEKALRDVANKKEIGRQIATTLVQRRLIEEPRETMSKRAEKLVGSEVTNLTEDVIKSGVWKEVTIKPYNVAASGKKIFIGKRQPYNRFLSEVRHKLVEMGFIEMTGPTIETEFWNFDALFQPQNHPSRDWTQTYSMKNPRSGSLPEKSLVDRVKQAHENGWKTGSTGWGYKWDPTKAAMLMPRAHGTAQSARTLAGKPKIPGKYFAISRCYRPDVIDVTHGVEFNQTEGIILDESLTFRSLLGVLKEFAVEFAGAEKIEFLPDYYPFTEPSVQLSAYHSKLGWVELGGAGIFREELTKPLGIDVPVIAWGLGIDRLAMFKLGINDIRNLFSQNLEWLRSTVI